ncbi:MAG: hypothetical protein GEV06_21815 [Luteitalea sp.]|nr:hypothetical protein [Luteitalea sp.]
MSLVANQVAAEVFRGLQEIEYHDRVPLTMIQRVASIQRQNGAKYGPGKGLLVSAFLPDGSLEAAWMNRLLRLQRALDDRGMVLVLMYFYQGQDETLRGPDAIRQAVIKTTDWLVENDCRNVIIEIANEHDVQGWDHVQWISTHMGDLMELARSRFTPGFRLPIGASTSGSMKVFDQVRDHADLTIIHGNGRSPQEKRRRVAELAADPKMPGPIFMNEDDNGRESTMANLTAEIASADSVRRSGGSWGYMPWRQVQMYPFRHYLPADGWKPNDDLPVDRRDQAYFRAVLEHIRKLVIDQGPGEGSRKKRATKKSVR